MDNYIIRMKNITKSFSGVKALDDVTFNVKRGEVHVLVGENGAGKSTLMNILSGVYSHRDYDGQILINEKEVRFNNIKDSEHAGIAIIHQELNLVNNLNVYENVYLGNEFTNGPFINKNKQINRVNELLEKVHLDISAEDSIADLGSGRQQLIEIVRAINKDAKIIIFDEPTSSLSESEVDNLLNIIEELKKEGITCIYISHKLNEVYRIGDTATVLRDGKAIATRSLKDLSMNDMIKMMVGREIDTMYPRETHHPKDVVLETSGWTVENPETGKTILDNVNINVRAGEIVGLSGLVGAGRTEFALSVFGAFWAKHTQGVLKICGKEVHVKNPSDAIKNGISYLPEDRKGYGLILKNSIKVNMTLASLRKYVDFLTINQAKETSRINEFVQTCRIKLHSILQNVQNLSGGNQQKVVIAKWLMTEPAVLIMDEPTRGVDVAGKVEIYNLMNQLVDQGVGILMISSELPEILGISDRIYVMCEGRITGEFDHTVANQEDILRCAAGKYISE